MKSIMEILKVAANKLKCDFSNLVKDDYIIENYGIKSCKNFVIKSFNSTKLELIFISNLAYVCLNDNQLQKIKAGNYKDLFTRKPFTINLGDVILEEPVIINNTYITNVTNINNGEQDMWDQTDW